MTVKQSPLLPKFVGASRTPRIGSAVLRTWTCQLYEREAQFGFTEFCPCIGQAWDGNKNFHVGKVEGCVPGYKNRNKGVKSK